MPSLFKVTLLLLATTQIVPTFANEKEQLVIDKIVAAYGGDTLTSMKSLVVNDRYKTITEDGGVEPGLDDVSRMHSTLTVDFLQGRKSVKNWTVQARGKRLGQIMFDGENGWSINYLRGSHVIRHDLNGNNVGAGMMRLLDTTLVRSLHDNRDTATFEGQSFLFGRPHNLLKFKINGTTEATLYSDKTTGLISQMTRPNGTQYIYSGHQKNAGVTYATDTNQLRNGQTVMVTLSRSIEVNPDVSKAFDLPKNTKALDGMQDNTKMVVKQLGEDVYIAGQGNRSSLFVDAGDFFVGVGVLPGFEKRLQAVNDLFDANKPVKQLVISEHQGHMGGINSVALTDTEFVTVAKHLPLLKTKFTTPLQDDRFVLVDEKLPLANGKVIVYDIQTITSEQFLLFYVPSEKLVYAMDEFGTNLLNSVPSADLRTLSFRRAIEALEIDVQRFAYVHGTGVLSLKQLQHVSDNYKEGFCPEGHAICAN